jgi:hypothetical protein
MPRASSRLTSPMAARCVNRLSVGGGTFHVILRSQDTVQMLTAGTVHVTTLTPPVGRCRSNQVDPCPITYSLSNP